MTETVSIGIDLGGTTIKMAIVDQQGNIVDKWEIPTDTSNNGRNISQNIADSIKEKTENGGWKLKDIDGIGIGAPGFINMENGFIFHAVNLGWKNYPLKDDLERKTGLKVVVDNDANTAALGEMWKGAGKQASDLICITLGTGIGGGIISNGTILHGANGMAGEIGHITSIVESGAPCNCGKTGCLETIASATGISRIATEGLEENLSSMLYKKWIEKGRVTAEDVFTCAAEGDDWANEVVKTITHHLGLAIANMANVINPSRIVIGGGVSKAGDHLMAPLKKVFGKYALPRVHVGADFAIASLGNDAGVIGSARLLTLRNSN
ncbi:ROK family glucokinase [Pseudalkalibacillus salsuginis]|uniref:ROK family glucokinase n=1 Tax=Pseudalkalibacillus salsuginis TaxID=2910972 RepID=UPI001F38C402|nr:ROK family glucokinase [Pseudalkalibacillus salsuginis]MCF6408464.1 ROK family glucokinase [Pseudalkalibacillus salsuginis]